VTRKSYIIKSQNSKKGKMILRIEHINMETMVL